MTTMVDERLSSSGNVTLLDGKTEERGRGAAAHRAKQRDADDHEHFLHLHRILPGLAKRAAAFCPSGPRSEVSARTPLGEIRRSREAVRPAGRTREGHSAQSFWGRSP